MDSRIIYFIVSVLDEHTVTPWIVPRVHSSSCLAVLAQLRLGLELAASVASPEEGNECPVTQHQTTEHGRIKRSRQLPRTPANTTADLPDVSRARINSDKLPRGIGSRRTPHKTDAAAGGIGKERRRDKKDPGDAGRRPGIAAGRSGRQRRMASSCGPMKQR